MYNASRASQDTKSFMQLQTSNPFEKAEKFAVSLRKQKKAQILSSRRQKLEKLLSKSVHQKTDTVSRKNEELYQWDIEELGSALARVSRDPEYSALDYLTVINDKLIEIPQVTESQNELKKMACWALVKKADKVFTQILGNFYKGSEERLMVLKIVSTLSSCRYEPYTQDMMPDFATMFADKFLETNLADGRSQMDLILRVKYEGGVRKDELESIFTIVGNFALDGIDSREKLVKVVMSSQFFTWQQQLIETEINLAELGLWAVECLMQEQTSKSHSKLAKKVYQIVLMIKNSEHYEDQFWSLVVACTAHSRANCESAYSEFFRTALQAVDGSLDQYGTVMANFYTEYAWELLINMSAKGPLSEIIVEGSLLDFIYRGFEVQDPAISQYCWRILYNFSVARQPLLNSLTYMPMFYSLIFKIDMQKLYLSGEHSLKFWLAALKNMSTPGTLSKEEYRLDGVLAYTFLDFSLPEKLCQLLELTMNDSKAQYKVLKVTHHMLKRSDQFSEALAMGFRQKTDAISIFDSLIAKLDNRSEKLLSLAIKINNLYLKNQVDSDDEEIYVGQSTHNTQNLYRI